MAIITAFSNKLRNQLLAQQLGPFWLSVVFVISSLLILTLSRIALIIWQIDRVNDIDAWLSIIIGGLRVDISTVSYISAIPAILACLTLFISHITKLVKCFSIMWYSAFLILLVYLEVITPTFINEYDLRPNRLLIEYLIYPKEVMAMLFSGYKLEILLSSLALLITAIVGFRFLKSQWCDKTAVKGLKRAALAVCAILLVLLGARSSLGHRPLNPAMVSFSTDHLLNTLALNSTYSAAFAIKQMQLENSAASYYGDMPQQDIYQNIRANTLHAIEDFTDNHIPTASFKQASYSGKPKNLVILLQESLGARFVGGLGGLPLTPNLDKLMQQGWNFSELYATGTRSVRGIEAVITGFPPTPSRAVVKLDKSQRDFFTIASLLKKHNYHTQFVYGGEAHFDNMKSFFLGNGFNEIVDSDDFEKIDFEGSWGASDEDLYDQAHLELEKLSAQDQPFFSLVFTSSNHSPFEYPDGKIEPYDSPKHTRNNAAKYSDFALGKFFEEARHSSYWDDTIFLVVADHDSRVFGAELVPVKHFRIPGVIIGKDIKPRQDTRLVSQIDLAPTLLSLIGISDVTPMLGHDLTQEIPVEKQRALMQYDKNFAYMSPSEITVLQPNLEPRGFVRVGNKLTEIPIAQTFIDRAKAHALFGSLAYSKQLYQLTDE